MLELSLILLALCWCVGRLCRAYEYPTRVLDGLEGELRPALRDAMEEE